MRTFKELTVTTEDIRRLYAYNRWATTRLLDAAASLATSQLSQPIGGSFGSLIGIFQHMVGAEWVWLERFHGRSPRAFVGIDALTTLEPVRVRSAEVAAELAAFVEGLSGESLGRAVAYSSFKGDAFTQPLCDLLQHVVNHGTYHRGQAAMALRLLGASVPFTDLVAFHRLER
jgi:uncharacterized damage-inducible protein DinB